MERLSNGVRHVRPRRRCYTVQDSNIYEAERLLTQGRYNEAEFLHRMAHCTKTLVSNLRPRRLQAVAEVAEGAADAVVQRYPAAPQMPPPHQVLTHFQNSNCVTV